MSESAVPSSIVSGEAPTINAPGLASAGSLLEVSRRVDWRFLLPDPNLGSVVVAGKASPSLREALTHFCQHVTFLQPPFSASDNRVQADVVVICGSLDGALATALDLVKPSGFVYIELTVRLRVKSLRGYHPLSASAKVLEARGFEDIQAFWHSPNFEGCKRIIPLDNPAALVYALKKTDNPVLRRLTREVIFFTHKSGLLRWGTRSVSLIARRGAA